MSVPLPSPSQKTIPPVGEEVTPPLPKTTLGGPLQKTPRSLSMDPRPPTVPAGTKGQRAQHQRKVGSQVGNRAEGRSKRPLDPGLGKGGHPLGGGGGGGGGGGPTPPPKKAPPWHRP